jgi:hypothetical protein
VAHQAVNHFPNGPMNMDWWLVGGLEHNFYFCILIGNNDPNWVILFRGVETTNQFTIKLFLLLFSPWIVQSDSSWSTISVWESDDRFCMILSVLSLPYSLVS